MIKEIRSDARNIGLKHDPIEDHLAAYRKSLTPGLLLEIPEWDGVDRIEKICTLVPARNLVPALGELNDQGMDYDLGARLYVEIVKDIGAGIFRRAFNSMEQNLFTIFRGPQGVGKNYFIEKLFCQPFQHYAAEVNVGTDQAKNYDAVEGRLVCVIGEFDQTQKVQVSFIKELITNASFTARRAYERTSDRYDLRQTFFSASNFQHVLKDTSGNRRFVIFDVPHINWEYNEHCDSQQLLAQYFCLYRSDFRMSDDARRWIKAFNKEETPDDPMELAFEEYIDRMRVAHRHTLEEWLVNSQVVDVINGVCKNYSIPPQRFRQELNRRKLTKKSNGVKYFNVARNLIVAKDFQVGPWQEANLNF